MRTFCLRFAGWVLAAGLVSAASAAGTAPGPARSARATNAPPTTRVLVAPRATFATNLPNGRDPFYPTSTRLASQSANNSNATKRVTSILDQLALKGICIGKRLRLALINSATLAKGETAQIKLSGQAYTVQCVEVRDRSAVVNVLESNETGELFLRTERTEK